MERSSRAQLQQQNQEVFVFGSFTEAELLHFRSLSLGKKGGQSKSPVERSGGSVNQQPVHQSWLADHQQQQAQGADLKPSQSQRIEPSKAEREASRWDKQLWPPQNSQGIGERQEHVNVEKYGQPDLQQSTQAVQTLSQGRLQMAWSVSIEGMPKQKVQEPAVQNFLKDMRNGDAQQLQGSLSMESVQPQVLSQYETTQHQMQEVVHSSPPQQPGAGVRLASRGQQEHVEVNTPTKQEGLQHAHTVVQQSLHHFCPAHAPQPHLYPSHPLHSPHPTVHLVPPVPVVFGGGEVITKREVISKGITANGTGLMPYLREVPCSSSPSPSVIATVPSGIVPPMVPIFRNGLGLRSSEGSLNAASGSGFIRREPTMMTADVPSIGVSITAPPGLGTSTTAVGTSDTGRIGIIRPGAMSLAPNVAVVGVWRGTGAQVNGAPARVGGGGHPPSVIGAGGHTRMPAGTHPAAVVGGPLSTPMISRVHPTLLGPATAHVPVTVGGTLPPSTGGPHPPPVVVAARSLPPPPVIGGSHSRPISGGAPIVLNGQPLLPTLARAVATPAVSTAWTVGGTTTSAPTTPVPPTGFMWNDPVPFVEHSPFAIIQPTNGPPGAYPWTGNTLHAPMIAGQPGPFLSPGSSPSQPAFVATAPANDAAATPIMFGWPSAAGSTISPVNPSLLIPAVGASSVPWVTAVLTPPNKSSLVPRTSDSPKGVVTSDGAVPIKQDSGKTLRVSPTVTLWPVTPVKKSMACSSEKEGERGAIGEVGRTDGQYSGGNSMGIATMEASTATETADMAPGRCLVDVSVELPDAPPRLPIQIGALDGKEGVAGLDSEDFVHGSSSVTPVMVADPTNSPVSEDVACGTGIVLLSSAAIVSKSCETEAALGNTDGVDVSSIQTAAAFASSVGVPGTNTFEAEKVGEVSVHSSHIGEVDAAQKQSSPEPEGGEGNGELEARKAGISSNSVLKSKSWAALVGVTAGEDGYVAEMAVAGVPAKAGMVPMPVESQAGVPPKVTGGVVQDGGDAGGAGHQERPAVYGSAWLKSLHEFEHVKRVQPIPRGLTNTGNSCFLNSTLQALMSCSPFFHLIRLLAAQKIPTDGKYPVLKAFVDFLGEFQLVKQGEVNVSKESSREMNGFDRYANRNATVEIGRPFVPRMFEDVLVRFSPNPRPRGPGRMRQEDAQEFLSYCLDCLHQELLMLQEKDESGAAAAAADGGGSPGAGRLSTVLWELNTGIVDEDEWETVGPKNKTAVTRTHALAETALSSIFGGQLRSVVKTSGNKASATVQPFMLLQLDIMPDSIKSVEDALHHFTAPESLDGYKRKGRAEVSASKYVRIQQLPRVLVLHLKRFTYDAQGVGKVHKMIRFPFNLTLHRDLLVPSAAVSPSGISLSHQEVRQYELVSIVSHHGKDAATGHYTTDAKQGENQWLRFDDCRVTNVPHHRVLDNDQAYLLLYKRLSML